ncbi:MAG: type IV pili twitching motility protein PilT, partial [Actinobacteria bacterium]|nr:type IV pili twitching motility protein PilT [Actinomycetota bacterium]
MLDLNLLLRATVERGASDLHIKVGATPFIRIDGRLEPIE